MNLCCILSYMSQVLFIHSPIIPIIGYLGCFQVLVIMNKAAIKHPCADFLNQQQPGDVGSIKPDKIPMASGTLLGTSHSPSCCSWRYWDCSLSHASDKQTDEDMGHNLQGFIYWEGKRIWSINDLPKKKNITTMLLRERECLSGTVQVVLPKITRVWKEGEQAAYEFPSWI